MHSQPGAKRALWVGLGLWIMVATIATMVVMVGLERCSSRRITSRLLGRRKVLYCMGRVRVAVRYGRAGPSMLSELGKGVGKEVILVLK